MALLQIRPVLMDITTLTILMR